MFDNFHFPFRFKRIPTHLFVGFDLALMGIVIFVSTVRVMSRLSNFGNVAGSTLR